MDRSSADQVRFRGSAAKVPQGSPFVQSDMIRFVAFDLVLWIVHARVVDIAFVVNIPGVHVHDTTTDPAGLGIPADVITDLEYLRHADSPLPQVNPTGPDGGSVCHLLAT
jgi:hypothetical protein